MWPFAHSAEIWICFVVFISVQHKRQTGRVVRVKTHYPPFYEMLKMYAVAVYDIFLETCKSNSIEEDASSDLCAFDVVIWCSGTVSDCSGVLYVALRVASFVHIWYNDS